MKVFNGLIAPETSLQCNESTESKHELVASDTSTSRSIKQHPHCRVTEKRNRCIVYIQYLEYVHGVGYEPVIPYR